MSKKKSCTFCTVLYVQEVVDILYSTVCPRSLDKKYLTEVSTSKLVTVSLELWDRMEKNPEPVSSREDRLLI